MVRKAALKVGFQYEETIDTGTPSLAYSMIKMDAYHPLKYQNNHIRPTALKY